MAAQSKDGKEKKGKDEVGVLVRRLADELASLRAEVMEMKAAVPPAAEATNGIASHSAPTEKDPMEALVAKLEAEPTKTQLLQTEDGVVARLGYALSSAPKIALVRHLMEHGDLSAAQLGERAGLTTGSLYHHLRELIHADVIEQSTRNRYQLSPRGRRAVLLLFAVAS